VRLFAWRHGCPAELGAVMCWAAESFGPDGRDGDGPVPPPPGGLRAAAGAVEALRRRVAARRRELRAALGDIPVS
jgi:hypothetical protein